MEELEDAEAIGDRDIVGAVVNQTGGVGVAGDTSDCVGARESRNAGEVMNSQPAKDDWSALTVSISMVVINGAGCKGT